MYIKNIVAICATLTLLTAVGCQVSEPSASQAIEGAKSIEPTLTSAAPTEIPNALADSPTEEAIRDRVDPPAVEKEPSFVPDLEDIDGLSIQRLVTAAKIEHREPLTASAVFGHHSEKVYAFVEASNASEQDKTLLVHFIGPDGQVSGGIELRIPAAAPRWRTWAFTRHAKTPGLWRVELRTADGSLLAALPFEVEPGC